MVYIKLVLAFTAVCFFGAAGFLKADTLKRRCTSLGGILLSLSRAEAEIRLGTVLPEILINEFERYFVTDGINFTARKESGLNESDSEILSSLALNVGMAETEDAAARLNAYRLAVSENLNEAKHEYTEKSRLYSLGGWLLGIGIAVIIF